MVAVSINTSYPTISDEINPLYFGNDGLHHYLQLGRDGETVVGIDSHLLNVGPQLASFHGVYD